MRFLIFIAITSFLFSCKGKQSPDEQAIERLAAAYKSNPKDSSAQALIQSISKYVETQGHNDSTSRFVLQAAEVSMERNQLTQALGFYKMYMIEYPNRPDVDDRLVDVIKILDKLQKKDLNQILYRAFTERFKDDSRAAGYAALIERKDVTVDSLLKEYGLGMFNDSIYRLDEHIARLYVDASEAAVMAQPELPSAPEYLHRAAETARTLRDIPKAISLYDWIIKRYPQHERGATALFLKAFTYDNDLKDYTNAKVYYEDFLVKYPNNEFAESAKFLLENLGKSDEELRQIIEEKHKDQPLK
ncbi:MAG: tetratricopeptide repeat protein [Bacteroidota bacterium]|nr:tetratricopeptide repeat protein [Bacteroidota bacterium]